MDKKQAAKAIIAEALPLIPFDGWNIQTLKTAAQKAGYKKTEIIRVFPGGAIEAAEWYMRSLDADLLEVLQTYHFDTMKIRQRITTAVRLKIELMAPHKEAIRKTLAFLALPFYAHRSLRLLYETVDTIWYAIGDTSTDFNFYTKRLTLAGVYSSTLIYWLDDKSPAYENTWAFLDRRIEDIMAFERLKKNIKQKFA